MAATRPVTHSVTVRPFHRPLNNGTRENRYPESRAVAGHQRSYTFVPKYVSESAKHPESNEGLSKHTSDEISLTANTRKARFSLPPIGLDFKNRSLTISHF